MGARGVLGLDQCMEWTFEHVAGKITVKRSIWHSLSERLFRARMSIHRSTISSLTVLWRLIRNAKDVSITNNSANCCAVQLSYRVSSVWHRTLSMTQLAEQCLLKWS